MKTVCIIIARMGSTRLPGKILMSLDSTPVLSWVARAAAASPGIDEVIVATSTRVADNSVCAWADSWGYRVFRGSESNVLSRFVGAARFAKADVAIRLTGDCPFVDPTVIGTVVRLQKQTSAPYCSNIHPRSFADGLDCEAISIDALEDAEREATRPIDLECVTTWIARNRSRFPSETVVNPIPGMQGERWVLDTADDLAFCRAIAERWPWSKGPPSQLDILGILDREPELRKLNASGVMNERYYQALADEPLYPRTYNRSQKQLEKASAVIPLAAQTFSKSRLQFPQPSPLFISHGNGGHCWDIDGNEYVDLVSALLPNVLGYQDPDVDAAIRRQLNSGISFSLATELEAELAETLCRLIPCAQAVRFGKTGTDATTAAVRAARAFTGRDRVMICGGYHGWADWTTARDLGVPDDVKRLTTRMSPGCAASYLAGCVAKYAAVIVEPESDPESLRYFREVCDKTGAVLIFDEIITGFRFHLGGAQALYGVTPDLATFGKAMANGMPLSCVAGRKDIMRKFEPPDNIFYSGTFFGETLSLAASIATIKKMERENVIAALWKTGFDLRLGILNLSERMGIPLPFETLGQDCLVRIKFHDHSRATADQLWALFRREMIQAGVLIINAHAICYAHDHNDIRRILKAYEHALGVIRDALDKGDIAERLGGAAPLAANVRAG